MGDVVLFAVPRIVGIRVFEEFPGGPGVVRAERDDLIGEAVSVSQRVDLEAPVVRRRVRRCGGRRASRLVIAAGKGGQQNDRREQEDFGDS